MEHLGVSYVENHDLCLVLLLVYDRFLKIEVYFILVCEKSPGLIERGVPGIFLCSWKKHGYIERQRLIGG